MTLSINMRPNQSINGGVGVGIMTAAGNPWSVPDALGNELINRGVATPNFSVPQKGIVSTSLDTNGNVIGLLGPSGRKLNVHSLRSRFFASLATGASYRSGKSILAAPAWAAGVRVFSGYVCQSGGNLYAAIQVTNVSNNGVVTAKAPAGTGKAPIIGADGIPWLYCGPADTALADAINACSIASATIPAACTLPVTLATNSGSGNAIDQNNIKNFWITGSDIAWAGGAGGGVNGIAAQNYLNSGTVDFMTDSPVVAMNSLQNYGAAMFNLTVDGYPLFPKFGESYPFTQYNGIANGSLVLDWSAKANKVRRVRFQMSNQTISGVWIPPQYSVWAPTNPNRYRMYFEGDSFTQGGSSGDGYVNAICHRVGAMLGCDDVWSGAVGGGGFIKVSNDTTTIVSRANKVIAAAPDILVCMPTDWDITYTSAQRRAAYVSYFTTLLAALPDLVIIASGARGVPNYGAFLAYASYNVDSDMAAAIASMNHPHIVYMDATGGVAAAYAAGGLTVSQAITLGLGRMWWSGTGSAVGNLDGNPYNISGSQEWNTGSQTTAGGANQDGHPNVRGLEVLQWQVFNAIVNVMNSLTD